MGDANKKLCYKANDGRLAYKASGDDAGKLCFKTGYDYNITLTAVSSQSKVGPIATCGHVHDVRITLDDVSDNAKVSKTYTPESRTITGATQSRGCSYPNENPSVTLHLIAVQPATGVYLTAQVEIENVALGSFTVTLSVDRNGTLTGLTGDDGT